MPGRTSIPLSTKIEILKELDKPGASLKIVAYKFKIGKTTVSERSSKSHKKCEEEEEEKEEEPFSPVKTKDFLIASSF